jgi:hypothetical protein
MRKTILVAATAFMIGGISTGALLSVAQPAPPPGAPGMPPAPGATGPGGTAPGGWHPGHMMHHGMHPHGMGDHAMQQGGPVEGMRAFALVYRQQDRALSPADAQKIAEAFLLWNGNHTWKIANAALNANGLIGFDMTSADGAVIAKFTMDPHTAKLTRVA